MFHGGTLKMESQTPENLSDSELVTFGDYIVRTKLGASRLATVWKAEHRISGVEANFSLKTHDPPQEMLGLRAFLLVLCKSPQHNSPS